MPRKTQKNKKTQKKGGTKESTYRSTARRSSALRTQKNTLKVIIHDPKIRTETIGFDSSNKTVTGILNLPKDNWEKFLKKNFPSIEDGYHIYKGWHGHLKSGKDAVFHAYPTLSTKGSRMLEKNMSYLVGDN
jgi:hypothetical protein